MSSYQRAVICWNNAAQRSIFAVCPQQLDKALRRSDGARPPFTAVMLCKVLLWQTHSNLPDKQQQF